jgi:Domain of unknown function (DUF4384)
MTRWSRYWALGVLISGGAHVALYALLLLSLDTEMTRPAVSEPKSVRIVTQNVKEDAAQQAEPTSETATVGQTSGAKVTQSGPPLSHAQAAEVTSAPQTLLTPEHTPIAPTAQIGAPAALQPPPDPVLPTYLKEGDARPVKPSGQKLSAAPSISDTTLSSAVAISGTSVQALAPQQASLPAAGRQEIPIAKIALVDTAISPLLQTGPTTLALSNNAPHVSPAPLPTAATIIALTWAGIGPGPIDPVSLATAQIFMHPSAVPQPDKAQIRDNISAVLKSPPCSRLQTVFNSETGFLELRGHVPNQGLVDNLVANLQTQVGASIPVTQKLRTLPQPTCTVLSGISALGLPQSAEQLTNPKIIGPDAHAREFTFHGGDRFSMELTTPDYDSFLYIDYFDANGQVIHLQPNQYSELTRQMAKTQLTIGNPDPNAPGLNMTFGPPYGQEIVVAFATSVQLFSKPRPLSEPAEPYLDLIRNRIGNAKATTADFKGEWVYFLISTEP